eukprot:jgi/Bigna1/90212/estExt_fgenesh1_pg.C_650052
MMAENSSEPFMGEVPREINNKSSCCSGKRICAWIACGLCIVGVALIIFFFFPRSVEGCVDRGGLAQPTFSFQTAPPLFEVSFVLPGLVRNSNYFDIKFKSIDITGVYRGEDVATGSISNFNAKARGESSLTVTMDTIPQAMNSQTIVDFLAVDCADIVNGRWRVDFQSDITLDTADVSFSFQTSIDLPCIAGSLPPSSDDGLECQTNSVL